MAALPPYQDSNSDTGDDAPEGPDRGSTTSAPPGTPRWVKVFGLIALGLVLLFVILHLTGRGLGPGVHTSSGAAGGHTPPVAHWVQQP